MIGAYSNNEISSDMDLWPYMAYLFTNCLNVVRFVDGSVPNGKDEEKTAENKPQTVSEDPWVRTLFFLSFIVSIR